MAFVGGIGSGKTRSSVIKALGQPAGSVGAMIAPTYPMLRDATLRTFVEIARPLITSFNRSELHIRLTDGKEILFRSADDPDKLRGPNLGWFAIDEAAMVPEETWDVMLGRLRLAPGRGWVTTTPRGQNWIYDLWANDPREGYRMVRARTRDNHYLPAGFVESLEAKYSSAYAAQELDGEFVEQGGQRVRREWLRRGDPVMAGEVYVGVDLAISTNQGSDYTACVAIQRDDRGAVYILEAVRARASFEESLQLIESFSRQHRAVAVVVENVAYQKAMVEQLARRTTLPVRTPDGALVRQGKLLRFAPLEARYEQGLVYHGERVPRWFEDELLSFPAGPHDDAVDALSYAWHALATPGPRIW